MARNVDQCFKKAHYDVLKCLVLTTTQRYWVHSHGGRKKPEICTFFFPWKISKYILILKMIDQLPKQLPVNLIVDWINRLDDAARITAIFHYYSVQDYIRHIPLESQKSQDKNMFGDLSSRKQEASWVRGESLGMFFKSVQLRVNRNINFHQPWAILTFLEKKGWKKTNILCM